METTVTVLLLVCIAAIALLVARALRAGVPTGESSSRADIYAAGNGNKPEQMDNTQILGGNRSR